MSYEKLNIERFLENLKAGHYESATGARRAVGKAQWPDATKDKARKAIDNFFAADAPKEKQKTAAKKNKAKTAKKETASKQDKSLPIGYAVIPASEYVPEEPSADSLLLEKVEFCDRVISATSAAIDAMSKAQNCDPGGIKLSHMQEAVDLLSSTLQIYAQTIKELQEAATAAESAYQGSNGVSDEGVTALKEEEAEGESPTLFS